MVRQQLPAGLPLIHRRAPCPPRLHAAAPAAAGGDLLEKIQWAQDNDAKAQQIAQNAKAFAEATFTDYQISCYWQKLLIRWGGVGWGGVGGAGAAMASPAMCASCVPRQQLHQSARTATSAAPAAAVQELQRAARAPPAVPRQGPAQRAPLSAPPPSALLPAAGTLRCRPSSRS